ncbi:MAG TPA: universal stress protein [Acidimicrobiales bacterium]|nr:universal stress protein [Acidimicrobiales bacterium]
MTRIVVGVDGSNRSKDALRWAARQAETTGAALDVVMAWERLNPDAWIPHEPPGTDPLAVTRRAVEGIVERVLGEHPSIAVTTRAMEGPAAKVLITEASGADLLVLGNRGHGGFAGLLLGSVSLHCLTHAHCPVVIVRPTHSPIRS